MEPPPTEPVSAGQRERLLKFQTLAAGALFAGRYEIADVAGVGGSGEVYRARDRVADADVAVKVLFPGAAGHDLERLRRELRVVRSLQHPGIVRVHDIGEADGLHFVVSEFLEGETLAARLRRAGRLPAAEAERILRDLLGALAAAHAAGVVHRDVKPGNVFLSREGRTVLLDFGLARETAAPGLTLTGRFLGTPEYAAPEQIRGEKALGPASDLYSLGVTAWEMVCGRPPFEADSEVAVLNEHLATPPPPVPASAAPLAYRRLVAACLEKESRRRPADGRAALAYLDGRHGWPSRIADAPRAFRRTAGRRAWWAVPALGLAGAALHLATPTRLDLLGDRTAWTTRSGLTWTRTHPLPVRSADLQPGWGPWRRALTLVPLADRPRDPEAPPFGLFWMSPLSTRPVMLGDRRDFGFLRQAGSAHWNELVAEAVFPLRPGASVAVPPYTLSLVDPNGYWMRLVPFRPGGQIYEGYLHPGRIVVTGTLDVDGVTGVVAAGVNNLLGFRSCALLLPLPAEGWLAGEGPPYTGSRWIPERARFYVPLPGSRLHSATLDRDSGLLTIAIGGKAHRVDARRGLPLDPADRGGLDETAYEAWRDRLWVALRQASASGDQGRPGEGAARLEAFAAAVPGEGPLRSIPWFRAAQLRLGAGGPEAALADVREARRAEPGPPRYGLLEAEILARLGRGEEAGRVLDAWWSVAEEAMYTYEWLLIDRLAGRSTPLEFLQRSWPRAGVDNWPLLYQLYAALVDGHPGQRDPLAQEMSVARNLAWDIHHYWLARLFAAGESPDLPSALRHLREASTALHGGVSVPWRLARHAWTGGREETREAALAELAEIRAASRTSVEALAVLPFAEADARAAGLLEDAP